MKEKLVNLLVKVKENKVVAIAIVAVIALILVIAIVAAVAGSGPKKYEEKMKDFTKALYSESKMKDAVDEIVDLRAAAAWQEADKEAEDFNKEYKKMKKNDDEVKDLEDALIEYAAEAEDSDMKIKISDIKKPRKDKDNKKIYTISATLENTETDTEVKAKFVFYQDKIIDIINKTTNSSLFESALDIF